MSLKIFKCIGGEIILPNQGFVLVSRQDGGNLVVNPPREVWERSDLNSAELTNWTFLVAATGKAMLDVLPQLEDGCINYWEAGNWALNVQAKPEGVVKTAKEYRKVHLHLLGRNPKSANPDLKWGEAPMFPKFIDRLVWAEQHERLKAEECQSIVKRVENLLKENFGMGESEFLTSALCKICKYPFSMNNAQVRVCNECQ